VDQWRQRERQAAQAVDGVVNPPAVVTLADGLMLHGDRGDAEVVEPMLTDGYELNELDFVRATVQPGDAVVDLGAHIGAYTLRLSQLVGPTGHVTAVEPCSAHLECLRRSVSVNGFDAWTDVVQAAASNVSGRAWLRYPPVGSSSAHCWLDEHETGDGEQVSTIAMDDLIDGTVQFIKVDVEGAEGHALRGAGRVLERSRPTLLVELHPHLLPRVSGETPAALIAWMASLDYECRLLGAGRPGPLVSDTPSNAVASAVFLPK
jgi:FkbM family methyltransferase